MPDELVSRRDFLRAVAAGAAVAAFPGALRAQQGTPQDTMVMGASNQLMNQSRYLPVRLPPKPGAAPSMTADARDALEHHIHCQCGCTLDIYTCRTTDFSCQVSPAMHKDVMSLVAGGHSAQEILDAFVGVYGEKVLMAPERTGFNWAGYLTPFAALAGGGALVVALLRRWQRPAVAAPGVQPLPVEASPDELAKLEALVRSEGDEE